MSSAYLPLSLALNYITVNVDAADPVAFPSRSGLRYYLSLMVPDSYLSNTFEELVEFEGSETPPKQVAGGTVYRGAFFELQDQLDSLLERTAPTFGQTGISVCDKLVTPYYVKARIENNGTLIYQAQTPVQYAIKAGVAETDFAAYRDTFFTEYIGAGCRFLTWAENGKRVQYDQPEFLYWLCNCSPLPSGLRLRVQTYPVEDLETVDVYTAATLTDITPMTVYGLAVGPAALGIENRVGTVASYSVWLEDLAGNKLTEERLYRIDPDYRRNVRFVLFANSLGGFDTLCLTGTGQESLKVVRNISDRNPDYSFSPSYAEKIINETTGERQLIVNTGFLSQSERTYLQELALTKEAYLVTDRAFLPLLPTMESVWASVDDENAAGRVLTFTYANPERNFSQLPTKNIAGTIRETGWRPKSSACLLDGNGKRTGMKAVTMIEQYYLDDGSRVVDAPIRPNVPGRVGYIPPDYSLDCQITPFLSAAINRSTTFIRATCTGGQQGGPAVIDLPAGAFGSEISQADADAKAEAEYKRLNTQAYADEFGACIAAPETYEWAVPAGKWHYRSVRPDKTDVVFRNADNYPIWGNSYFVQNQGGANTYPYGTNDLDFPANNDGFWLFRVYGPVGTSKRVRMYRNAVLVQDRTVIMNRDGYEQVGVPSGFSFASGDKFLIRADDL